MPRMIVTANRLDDGRVVFLTDSGWSSALTDAAVAADESAAETLLERARADEVACTVVAAYTVPLDDAASSQPFPERIRERIRADGPTIAFGHQETTR